MLSLSLSPCRCCCFSLFDYGFPVLEMSEPGMLTSLHSTLFGVGMRWLCLAQGFLDVGLLGLEVFSFQDLDLSWVRVSWLLLWSQIIGVQHFAQYIISLMKQLGTYSQNATHYVVISPKEVAQFDASTLKNLTTWHHVDVSWHHAAADAPLGATYCHVPPPPPQTQKQKLIYIYI